MDAIGKTVARIEERPTDPEYGRRHDDTLLIHFTDGTALEVQGGSYEEVTLDHEVIDTAAVRRRAAAAQGRREDQRIGRLGRAEWLSVSCEERAQRRAQREARMSPFARAMRDTFAGSVGDVRLAMNRQLFGGPEQTATMPCGRCGETECENAETKVIPATPFPETLSSQLRETTITIPRLSEPQ